MKTEKNLERIREEIYKKGYKKFPKIIEDFDKLILKFIEGEETLADIRMFRDELIKMVEVTKSKKGWGRPYGY